MDLQTVLFAFGLTLFAGLSTGIGSALAFYTKKTNETFLSVALGFSAGVMIYVSLIEIFVKARASLEDHFANGQFAYLITTVSFFGGIALIAIIDKLVPSAENPHEIHDVSEMNDVDKKKKALLRMGLFSALAIAIHNFPEGLATFMSAIQDPTLGISIAIAIAIHNVPEGIAVSVPVFYATGSKRKAFMYSFLSGLAEPVGALIGYFILYNVLSEALFGIVFASVAGIMVYISLDELLPTAEKYGKHHFAIGGLIAGMAVMAISLVLFA
ncbi:zinc transporter ZupT [Candidatus Xianfuyuplasma coldseepsis]|uniref:Zinc transporter ZupT n=1 Tax=Candidatus Xianfuyuplasma coldseepsis TaxID=2782163 RepID=A0A7L7KT59_9MOLU|nr:zinc transporter ZupT [Xianfuyuplasma coldseepsis]QMS85472.1 zinc transporter ZupT [Xianfuyuplasma coldseepsis]